MTKSDNARTDTIAKTEQQTLTTKRAFAKNQKLSNKFLGYTPLLLLPRLGSTMMRSRLRWIEKQTQKFRGRPDPHKGWSRKAAVGTWPAGHSSARFTNKLALPFLHLLSSEHRTFSLWTRSKSCEHQLEEMLQVKKHTNLSEGWWTTRSIKNWINEPRLSETSICPEINLWAAATNHSAGEQKKFEIEN